MATKKRPKKRAGRKDKKALKAPAGAGLEETILQRYSRVGVGLLSDDRPDKLDPSLRRELEPIVGTDLSDVRLHTGERAAKMAEAMGAKAFAAGQKDVFFARDQFAPQTAEGKALLAHELTHVAEGHIGLKRAPDKAQREELEARADAAEARVLAREQAAKAKPDKRMIDPVEVDVGELEASGRKKGAGKKSSKVDKVVLEQKVIDILDRQMQRNRERTGH